MRRSNWVDYGVYTRRWKALSYALKSVTSMTKKQADRKARYLVTKVAVERARRR